MKSGKVQRGEECTGNAPPSQLQWDTRRLVFNQGSAANLLQPNTLTRYAEYRPPYKDPGIANVMLHNVGTVQTLPIGSPQSDPLALYNADEFPQVVTTTAGVLNVANRGLDLPQYKVQFMIGDTAIAVIFADGNSVLAMPCASVIIDALTTPLLVPASKGEIVFDPVGISGDLVVEALATATVAWSKGSGVSGPQGMATFTQRATLDSTGLVITPSHFQRPPFARRVVVIPPLGVAGFYSFMSTQLITLVTPPGVANSVQQPQDIPAGTKILRFTPAAVPPPGQVVTVIWEIGVR